MGRWGYAPPEGSVKQGASSPLSARGDWGGEEPPQNGAMQGGLPLLPRGL